MPQSKGQRAIIVHAGGKQNFIKNTLLIFKLQQQSSDYHDDTKCIN